jgi:hypothetical protein
MCTGVPAFGNLMASSGPEELMRLIDAYRERRSAGHRQPDRLGLRAQLLGHRADHHIPRTVLVLVVHPHPHRALARVIGILPLADPGRLIRLRLVQ